MSVDITTARTDIAKIYIAAFNRVPDSAGLDFWTQAYIGGSTLASISEGFTSSQEHANIYPTTQTAAQYVAAIYLNVFGRTGDGGGLTFWEDAVNAGTLTHATLMNEMITAATASTSNLDGQKLTNKATFGVNTVDAGLDVDLATAQLANITSDTATITTATAAADTVAPTMSSAAVSADGQSIVVTYSELLSGTPEAGDYGVTLSSGSTTVSGATIGSGASANKVTLTLSNSISNTVTVSNLVYTATAGTANSIKDTATNPVNSAATQTLSAVTNSSAVSHFTLTASTPVVTEIMVNGATTKAMTFALTLSSVPTEAVTINYATQTAGTATSGSDFTVATGTVTFAAGQTVAHVSVVVNADATAETDETVAVLFSGASLSGNVTGTGTILANDTVGNTVVLTAGVDAPVLSGNDDTINTNAPTQLTSADTIAGALGTDTLSITPTTDTALTLDDAIFTNVSGIEKIVILTTGTGAQTITTGLEFNGAFGTAGADLETTSTTGAQTINMSAVTGPATLTSLSDASIAGNSITMGAGITTVKALSTTGAMTINSAASAFATVTVTTTTGAVSVTTGGGDDVVTLTTGDTSGNSITTGAGADTIIATAVTATTFGTTITGGTGADTIILTGNTSKDTVVIANTDSGITVATADSITGFTMADDHLKMGVAGSGASYVEAASAITDFAAAFSAANVAMTANVGVLMYSFQFDATNGYLFVDNDFNGTADQVVVLVGITNAAIAAANVIA